jgi:hypothetical protein
LAASGEHLILSAADSNQIAIPGNPPLTVGLMHNISGFTQWALDIRFSDAQEQQFNQILQLYWAMNDRDEIAGGILAGVVYQRLPALDGSQRVQLQQQFKSKLLSNLYSDSDRPDHQWLLLIYRAHHPEEGPPAENNNDGINAFKNWADSNRQFNGIMNDRMIFPSLR